MTARAWLNRDLYPFEARHLDVEGGRMHYVDEGDGAPIVLVHGTPTWSFLYRDLIRDLSRHHRVVAPDHLGFGLSDKPADAAYRPEDHAARLERLIETLGLRDVTLVVHDFGGPIGLAYALRRPKNVRALVLFNTWMWSLEENRAARMASRLAASPIGRFLYRRLNFSPRMLIPAVMGDRKKLSKEEHRHYTAPFPTSRERTGPWVLAKELIGSSDWYRGLWERRDRIADKPALLLWGIKDPTFAADTLDRWREALPAAEVETFPEAGHFVQEEVDGLGATVRGFIERTEGPGAHGGGRVVAM